MGKTVVKEDEKIDLTQVDGDLEVQDGATINVPKSAERLTIIGKLESKNHNE